jgi:DNA-directed RNA polymerase subunit E'/Rpb7
MDCLQLLSHGFTVVDQLQGTVVESFPSHLGVLVLGYFNAMIPAERLTEAGYAFDNDLQEWSKEDGSSTFTKDEKVDFRVDRIHESVGTLSIEGSNPVVSPFSNYPSLVQAEE